MTIASRFSQSVGQPIKKMGTDFWNHYIENAAPAQRHLDVAYVPLQREENGKKVDVGVFVPELYLIAKAGFLPAQIKAKKILGHEATGDEADADKLLDEKKTTALYDTLYRHNGSNLELKTPFELAIIPSNNSVRITAELMDTYQWLRKNGYEWPNYVSKARVVSDYLAHLNDIHFSVKESGAQSVHFTVKNSPEWASKREKLMHFLAPWIASLVTMSAIISVVASYSLPALMLYGIGTYLAYECANQFGIYDLAENLYREIGWLKSKEYRQGELSWRNALYAGLQLAAIGFACFMAAQGAWAGIAGVPFLQSMPHVSMALSGFFASIAGLSTFVGLSGGIRYLWGLSIYNNQMQFISQNEGASLPALTKDGEKEIKRWSKRKALLDLPSSDSEYDAGYSTGYDSNSDSEYSERSSPTYLPLNQASNRVSTSVELSPSLYSDADILSERKQNPSKSPTM